MKPSRILIAILAIIILGLSGCLFASPDVPDSQEDLVPTEISNFEECLAAGNPVMESYPRQCRHGDRTFVEEIAGKIAADAGPLLTEEEALLIAGRTGECTVVGVPAGKASYNENSKTWWVDLERMPELEKDGCNPACVVWEENKTAEVNWRCTGLIPPNEPLGSIMQKYFVEKYPKYADTLSVSLAKETQTHASGSISFVPGEAGGQFLAAKVDDTWQVVYEGNGSVDCDSLRNEYGFQDDMLQPNFCD